MDDSNTVDALGHVCLAINSIINAAHLTGVLTADEHRSIYEAVWGIDVARRAKVSQPDAEAA